jgi:hypothetical protein
VDIDGIEQLILFQAKKFLTGLLHMRLEDKLVINGGMQI